MSVHVHAIGRREDDLLWLDQLRGRELLRCDPGGERLTSACRYGPSADVAQTQDLRLRRRARA
jgi:hypothetical protein